MIAFPSVVIFLCTGFFKEIKLNFIGDLSYGIYLYHFPIIQLLQHLKLFDYNAYMGLLITSLATFSLAYLSWHLLENRFLKRSVSEPVIG